MKAFNMIVGYVVSTVLYFTIDYQEKQLLKKPILLWV